MENITSNVNTGNKFKASVVVILAGNELYGLLTKDVIDAEQDIRILDIDFCKTNKADKTLMGFNNYSRTGKIVPIYNLPRLLGKSPFIAELKKMQQTKQAHIAFFDKLKKICEQRIKTLNGESLDEEEININSLQTDHTQCEFGRTLFSFLAMFNKHIYICDYLKTFIQPHKRFHSQVIEIQNHINDADKIQELFEEIETHIYPEILDLFDRFDKEVESEISRNIYIFAQTANQNTVGLRVNKALLLCELEFELSETLSQRPTYIAIDKENKLNLKTADGSEIQEENMIQLLDINELLK